MKHLKTQILQIQKLSNQMKGLGKIGENIIAENEAILEAQFPGVVKELKKNAKNKDLNAIKKQIEELQKMQEQESENIENKPSK